MLPPQVLCLANDYVTFSGVETPLPDRSREKEEPVVREASEAIECHLSDLLQQLISVNASKPSERGLVRQGEYRRGPHIWRRLGILISRAPISYSSKSRCVSMTPKGLPGVPSACFCSTSFCGWMVGHLCIAASIVSPSCLGNLIHWSSETPVSSSLGALCPPPPPA